MIDQERLTIISYQLWLADLKILQGFRLALSDREHIDKLLGYMKPDVHATWLDIGCGFGEPARLMHERRPDLKFWLVNNNVFQLSQVPDQFNTSCCDMHEMPFEDGLFDGAMFLYSLKHADDYLEVLKEAARVVRSGGRLFVFDYFRTGGDNDLTMKYLSAQFVSYAEMQQLTRLAGWEFDGFVLPEGSDAVMQIAIADEKLYRQIFDDLVPVVWWATRAGVE